ncbi:unnamed protein product [Sphagnum balticum]
MTGASSSVRAEDRTGEDDEMGSSSSALHSLNVCAKREEERKNGVSDFFVVLLASDCWIYLGILRKSCSRIRWMIPAVYPITQNRKLLLRVSG